MKVTLGTQHANKKKNNKMLGGKRVSFIPVFCLHKEGGKNDKKKKKSEDCPTWTVIIRLRC